MIIFNDLTSHIGSMVLKLLKFEGEIKGRKQTLIMKGVEKIKNMTFCYNN